MVSRLFEAFADNGHNSAFEYTDPIRTGPCESSCCCLSAEVADNIVTTSRWENARETASGISSKRAA